MVIVLGVISYATMTYMIVKRKDEEKKKFFFGFIVLINIVSIELVNHFSIDAYEQVNHMNYSLFFYPLVIISVVWTAREIYKLSQEYLMNADSKKCIQITVVGFFALAAITLLFIENGMKIIDSLGGTPNDKESIIYNRGWINAYTNPLYINVYFYNIVIIISLFSSGIKTSHIKRKENKQMRTIEQKSS